MGRDGFIPDALNGANASYLADLHNRWLTDPASVDPSFVPLFGALGSGKVETVANGHGDSAPSMVQSARADTVWDALPDWAEKPSLLDEEVVKAREAAPASPNGALINAARNSIRAMELIRAYRVRGHFQAVLDPLNLKTAPIHADLDPASYGFTAADMERPIYLGHFAEDLLPETPAPTMHVLLAALRRTYCGPIGFEYMHIQDPEKRQWLQSRVEADNWRHLFSAAQKQEILSQLTAAEGFESFCHRRYSGTKRFGLEGSEVTIPVLHGLMARASIHGTRSVSLGMAHRGRLNVMANVVQKPFAAIFSEFAGGSFKPQDVQGSGDVKYHLGTAATLQVQGRDMRVTLLPNPSHLEAVNPVVVGRVRALQDLDGCVGRESRVAHLAIQIHGDAAFAGQGVVYETMAMSELVGYRTGGTVHIVINNQIGFTTMSAHAYSGLYCTDIAKSVQAPILHVNGDEPEAAAYCARLAADFRTQFASDIVIDLVTYRRHGHNEGDEPAFTQPTMYKAIAARETTRALYARRLVRECVVTQEEADRTLSDFFTRMDREYEAAKSYTPRREDWLDCRQDPTRLSDTPLREQPVTGISAKTLKMIGAALTRVPEGFSMHPRLKRFFDARRKAFDSGEGFDWATGEALAFGSLLLEGHPVRLSGEDCQRGTFSQRHAVLIDQLNQEEYVSLNHIGGEQARIEIYNSLLSEFGVLGFEYGYTLAAPDSLVLWEAQFGDFANGAQVIIDQFIASGEVKWLRSSGLVLLLPHGYEGQGPEHSSARIERYLQLCAENNLRVCVPSTPANYFHALRRQIIRPCRKPLIVFTPKSLLRHKNVVSSAADFTARQRFRTVIKDEPRDVKASDVKRVILCSGKIYYDLAAYRDENEVKDAVLVRVEQLYPFPTNRVAEALAPYPHARIVWCQEESQNSGAWHFVDRYIESAANGVGYNAPRPIYNGRLPSASPATGLLKEHERQQKELVASAFAAPIDG